MSEQETNTGRVEKGDMFGDLKAAYQTTSELLGMPDFQLDQSVRVGFYSSQSGYKLHYALLGITEHHLIPILPPVKPLSIFTVPELNPLSGEIVQADLLAALNLGPVVPQGSDFARLNLPDQVRWQALLKAVLDWNVQPTGYVWATDVRGKVGDVPLSKEISSAKQARLLNLISQTGVVDVAVGMAAGSIQNMDSITPTFPSLLTRLREAKHFVTRVQQLRIHISQFDMLEYQSRGSDEISRSGLVIDFLSPDVASSINMCELKIGGKWIAVELESVKPLLAGYPIGPYGILPRLINIVYSRNPAQKNIRPVLETAHRHLEYLYYNSSGQLL